MHFFKHMSHEIFGCTVFYPANLRRNSEPTPGGKGVWALTSNLCVPVEMAASSGLWKNSTSANRSWSVQQYRHGPSVCPVVSGCAWRDGHCIFSMYGAKFMQGKWPGIQELSHKGKINPSILLHYFDGGHSYMLSMALMSIFKLLHCNPVVLAGLYSRSTGFI